MSHPAADPRRTPGPTPGVVDRDRAVVPGELLLAEEPVTVNPGRARTTLAVVNAGDRPVQVGSHFHFAQTNAALVFDRAAARGLFLDVPAGTAVRFEPGIERSVDLVPLAGSRQVWGLSLDPPGRVDGAAPAEPVGEDA